ATVVDRLARIATDVNARVASARDALPSAAASADPLAPATPATSNGPVASEAPATSTAVEPACTRGPTLSHLPIRPKLSREDAAESRSGARSEEHTSELQSRGHLVCRLLLEKKNRKRSK